MVPGVIMPPCWAVKQGARVGRAPGAEDHTGDDQRKGTGAGTEPAQGAAQHLHLGVDDAEQRMAIGGVRLRTPIACRRPTARSSNARYQLRR